MILNSKAKTLKNIRKVNYQVNGKSYTKHTICFGTDGRGGKIRASRATRDAAITHVKEFYILHRSIGDAVGVLKPIDIYDAKAAYDLLTEAGIKQTLTDTVRQYLSGKTQIAGVAVESRSLIEAYMEYYSGIPEIQHLHRKSIRARVLPWVNKFGSKRMVSEVTARDLAAYLAPLKSGPTKTYNNKLTYIKSFLQWCARDERMYIKANPAAGMKADKIIYKEPGFVKANDFERFVRAIEARKDGRQIMTFIALSYMCGVRREEITRIMEEPEKCVLINQNSIRVGKPKGWTQGCKPRIFTMPPNAEA
ncbi:MAG: hypothetical protein PF904_03260 [Kiritimatiellae bacterium]|jgi:integrase|nr:hypothetical protein [Kiritimatiellia bacterium]